MSFNKKGLGRLIRVGKGNAVSNAIMNGFIKCTIVHRINE